MRLRIDDEADALHLQLADVPTVELEKLPPGSLLTYDESSGVIGIEVLSLSKRPHPINLMDFQFETRPKKLTSTG